MVKFQKQLEGDLVPEWRAAYCNYKLLKKELNRVKRSSFDLAHQRHLSESHVFSLSALARRRSSVHPAAKDAIKVRNLGTSGSPEVFETELMDEALSNDDNVKVFFQRLDAEFNKVNRFYKCREEEFLQRAHQLDKQITTLLQLKNLVQEQGIPPDNKHTLHRTKKRDYGDHDELLPGQPAMDHSFENKLSKDNAIHALKKSDFDSPASQSFGLDSSAPDISVVDLQNSVEELTEIALVENNETVNDDTRNDLGTADNEIEAADAGLEATEQEDVFISNEQELPPDKIQFEMLSISPRMHLLPKDDPQSSCQIRKASVPQSADMEEVEEAEIIENLENVSTTSTASPAVESVEAEHPVEHMRRGTIKSVMEDMEHQVEESRGQVRVNINMPVTTPVATISAISHILWEDILQQVRSTAMEAQARNGIYLSKKKVNYAEKVLFKALVEFYRGLGLLKSYSSLNTVAFAKILKKFDKATDQYVAPIYIKAVENSYFVSSDRVLHLMERVEKLFTKYFHGNNRRKAMAKLRPMEQKASHRVSFLVGVFSGASVALVGVLAIIAPTTLWRYKAGGKSGQKAYYESVFPLFSMMGLILLHMYMWGCDIYLWCRFHINYVFIFEFAPGKVLRHRDMFFLSTSLTCLYLGVMVGHIAGHYSKKPPSVYIDFLPMTIVVFFLLLLFCPFNIIYRSSRAFLLRTFLHVLCAPLYKVVLADFFLADQLTSQVPSFRQLEWVLCNYIGNYYKRGDGETCSNNTNFQRTVYFVSLVPYWWRFAQCVRRYIDEGNSRHILNCAKYFSAMLALALRVSYSDKNKSTGLLIMTILWSVIATTTQLWWDLVMDWGLLDRKSKNPWLRDSLILHEYKSVYYVSMVLDAILRLAWLQSVARWKLGRLDTHMTEFIFAGLEIIRRGIWNFFRIENEHLNNIGRYRAVTLVPLPFVEIRTAEEP